MISDSAGSATQALEMPTYELRVDQVLESKHKVVSSRPGIVEFENAGRRFRLMLPIDCPACDFLVTAAAKDLLFLIGRQRVPQDAPSGRGAVVIARRCEEDLYVTVLWHETYDSFLWRSGLAPVAQGLTNPAPRGSQGKRPEMERPHPKSQPADRVPYTPSPSLSLGGGGI